ncbi:LuxR C-terminal-related transcriptional regulator [Nocardiopsis aegyptia]|uniref:DNA-binding CsgD family transcriptional regulator n=1 Tax=Nocardiopsis aegyptia TaxID=220378 RepID=A0A7Z0EI30_9ACTN|nr:LuxR C-terminal-related transcriptional regulator [Nocardiopsis aegyptia]NYJ32453.1 DNA-binding CsgD family transcriptional regulator [Nocardiopsis aegyptia]
MAATEDEWNGAVDSALARIVDESGADIAFGARLAADGRSLVMTRFRGARTAALRDLAVHSGTGLGGKALVLDRPVAVDDYVRARSISHEYDRPVAREGLHSILAVPLRGADRVTGVLYAALRQRLPVGERMLRQAVAVAREAERRMAAGRGGWARTAWPENAGGPGAAALPEVRAELGRIIPRVGDADVRRELEALWDRIGARPGAEAGPGRPALSVRECETLGHVAAGLSNAQTADRMGLTVGTVKAYLRSVMRKLDCHNRVAAVNAARALGYPL